LKRGKKKEKTSALARWDLGFFASLNLPVGRQSYGGAGF